jgi:hypothetical protein
MEDFKLINLGVYYEHLKDKIENLYIERKEKKDPIEQYVIDEKIKLVNELLNDYDILIMKQ